MEKAISQCFRRMKTLHLPIEIIELYLSIYKCFVKKIILYIFHRKSYISPYLQKHPFCSWYCMLIIIHWAFICTIFRCKNAFQSYDFRCFGMVCYSMFIHHIQYAKSSQRISIFFQQADLGDKKLCIVQKFQKYVI